MTVHRLLQRARILDMCSESEVEGLALLGEERTFDTGELLFREGQNAEGLYILLHGQVKLSCIERGQELELQRHHPGDHFSPVTLVDGQTCYTRAVGLSFGKVFVLSNAGCAALLSRLSRGRPLVRKVTPPPVIQTPVIKHEVTSDTERPPPSSMGDSGQIRSLSSAVAGVAHEINTPLGVIENAASFMGEQLSEDNLRGLSLQPAAAEVLGDVAEACRLIQKNVAHAARLVQSFKKLSVGQLAEPRQQLDLVRVIQEVLNVFKAKTISALPPGPYQGPSGKSGQHRLILASSRLDVRVSCALPESDRIWDGFPGLFSRVLLNLLTNIDRYAYPGTEPGKVDLHLDKTRPQRGEPRFELSVRDYGVGISQADLPHIFDPFFTTGRDKGGTGLGLAMVHNLVTQGFNGTVRAVSMEGEGTTFELSFPTRAPDHGSVLNQSLEPHHRLLDPKPR